MYKILVVDDHAVVRRGLRQILEDELDSPKIYEAANLTEALNHAHKQNLDAAIIDLDLSGKSGLELLKELKILRPKLPVLILSVHPEDQFAVRTLKAGAAGYMTKASAPDDLIKAILKIIKGGNYISEVVAEQLLNNLNQDSEKPLHENLSDREYQIMSMIASGKNISRIAEDLALSISTISTYRARILEKMRMKSNAELTHYAVKEKLV